MVSGTSADRRVTGAGMDAGSLRTALDRAFAVDQAPCFSELLGALDDAMPPMTDPRPKRGGA